MRITEFSLCGFRNISQLSLSADENVNIIFGENAQGKTNILEGMWLFSGLHSFRGAKEKEMIHFGSENSRLEVKFFASGREQEAKITISSSEKKKIILNGVKEENSKRLSEKFKITVFSPVHLSLIKEGPSERRSFIDTALCQLKSGYIQLLTEYSKTLSQRNALLKDAKNNSSLLMLLEIWEQRLCYIGAKVTVQRKKYIENLTPAVEKIFEGISDGKERISLEYFQSGGSGETEEEIKNSLFDSIQKARQEDFSKLSTSVGPHRDDLKISVNQSSARAFASQGQQRSCALALKLGEADVLRKITGEIPVILLDDVMSELDARRQEYVFNNISDKQVFITCCEPSSLFRNREGKIFQIKNGAIL